MPFPAHVIQPIPRETVRVAKSVFGRSNFYILLGEQLPIIVKDIQWERLSGTAGLLLPLVTIFQALEGLTDIQAVDAVRTRMDWKFALHLNVHGSVVREIALCEFRRKVKDDPASRRQFGRLVNRVFTVIPTPGGTPEHHKPLHMLWSVCCANQRSLISEAMQQALEALALRFPRWLQKVALPHWYGRYRSTTPEMESISSLSREELSTAEICEDIHQLLEEIQRSGPPEIDTLPEIKALQHIWRQQLEPSYQAREDPSENLKLNNCDSCIYATGGI